MSNEQKYTIGQRVNYLSLSDKIKGNEPVQGVIDWALNGYYTVQTGDETLDARASDLSPIKEGCPTCPEVADGKIKAVYFIPTGGEKSLDEIIATPESLKANAIKLDIKA
jgi:hypothetical protein